MYYNGSQEKNSQKCTLKCFFFETRKIGISKINLKDEFGNLCIFYSSEKLFFH